MDINCLARHTRTQADQQEEEKKTTAELVTSSVEAVVTWTAQLFECYAERYFRPHELFFMNAVLFFFF